MVIVSQPDSHVRSPHRTCEAIRPTASHLKPGNFTPPGILEKRLYWIECICSVGSSKVNWVFVKPCAQLTHSDEYAGGLSFGTSCGRWFARYRQQMYSVSSSICIWLGRPLQDGAVEAGDGRVDQCLTVASITPRPVVAQMQSGALE